MSRLTEKSNGLALRLFALIVVPLVGLGVLAVQRIEEENDNARNARALVDDARLEQTVAAVYAPAQLEQIALEGLAAVDLYDLPRDLVVTLAGVDFSLYTSNTAELDDALAALDGGYGEIVLDDGRTLEDRLEEFRTGLDRQRSLSADGEALQEDVRMIFTDLDDILASATRSAGLTVRDGETGVEQRKLAATSLLFRTAGDRGRSLLEGLIDGSPGNSERTVAASAQMELAVEQLRLLLDDDEAAELDVLVSRLEPLPASISEPRTDTLEAQFDPNYIRDSAGGVLNQFEFLELLETYAAGVAGDVVTELESQAGRAEEVSDRTRVLVAATVAVSLALLAAIAWSILRPLRRLTRRAQLIGNGDFGSDPLPVIGPSDVRSLTSTVNTMAHTLAGVDEEISRLADSGSLGTANRLPGAIGESIDASFRRLHSVTTRLHASEMLASAIVAEAADAIWTIDMDGEILSANESSVRLLGVSSADQIGTRLTDHVPSLAGETTVSQPTGDTAHVVVSSSLITDGAEPVTAVMAHDISERRRFQERLAHQAHHDALTGLPNRPAILDALDRSESDGAIAVLFVDLDGFKSVNDMQGHLVGDRVLSEVGARLRNQVRRNDVVGRLGGDEFVVVMTDVTSDREATDFASRLVIELEQPFRDGSSLFSLSASVGVATFLGGLDAEDLTPLEAIRRADSAVYAAKARGRGHVEVYDSALENRLMHDAEIEHALRIAIGNDELELHLQPILDLATGTFTSAEALVRWDRPGRGLVPPGEFIPIAEKSSLIEDIGRWVLRQACSTLADWMRQESTRGRRIAVNIAGSHLLEGELIADIDAALASTGADARMLEIELTESQLMDDYDRVTTVLRDLRSRGIRIAIDDFGTGYSSMAYLRELPIDTLKIDRSFVSPISDADSDTTVIDALVTIGQALELSIVAEGIETRHQLDHLTRIGCDRAQGFLMARPMPADDASSLVGQRYPGLVASS